MAVLNVNDAPKTVILPLEAAGVSGNMLIKNLWDKTELVKTDQGFELILPAIYLPLKVPPPWMFSYCPVPFIQ